MKLKIYAVTLLAAVALTACSGGNTNQESSAKILETKNIKELVNDYSVGNKKAENASVTSAQLTVTEMDGSQLVYALPEDEFFVSIAPYVSQTHD